MKLFFVAGEVSGDNHGAALMRSLGVRLPQARLSGRGGPRMKQIAGPAFVDWIDDAAVVGLWEVIKHYGFFRREFRKTLNEIAAAEPDAVILIDYPGFNLRLARALRERSLGGKIIYYISPQVWAWNRGRIPKMAKWLDLMLCIFPFEAELYSRSGLRTVFVGHPMLRDLAAQRIDTPREPELVGLFPGSRAREVRKLLPIVLAVVRQLCAQRPHLRFEVAAASDVLAGYIRSEIARAGDSLGEIEVVVRQTARTMQKSAVGIVASGTATLEAAFFRLPFVLVYKVAPLTYLAGKAVIKVKHLGMPNVIAQREIVPEFVQSAADPVAIAREVLRLLDEPERREKMVAEFGAVIRQLGENDASEAAASAIVEIVA
ncbi:MAG TPA: lipid-A-disaccharide synthase [Chthoniobacterales bacterium]|jgi:lipid-A-disaccharide synthase